MMQSEFWSTIKSKMVKPKDHIHCLKDSSNIACLGIQDFLGQKCRNMKNRQHIAECHQSWKTFVIQTKGWMATLRRTRPRSRFFNTFTDRPNHYFTAFIFIFNTRTSLIKTAYSSLYKLMLFSHLETNSSTALTSVLAVSSYWIIFFARALTFPRCLHKWLSLSARFGLE